VPEGQAGQRQWLAAVLAVDADPWLRQFRQAVAKRPWPEVERLAGQAEVARYHPAVLVGLARNLHDQAPATALLLLRRTQQQYPGDFWANLHLGITLYMSIFPRGADRPAWGEELPVVNEAVAFFRVAVGLRPGNAPAHTDLGVALQAQGDVKGAIACWRKALDLDPKLALAHYSLGLALQQQGDLAGAIACWRKALDLDPKYARAHCNLGVALQEQGDVKGAIACYQKALDLDPKLAPAHTSLGLALKAQGDVKGAIACYTKALGLDPNSTSAHYNLGNALKDQGDYKGAIAHYHKSLDLDPKDAPAHNNLGNALKAQGDVKGAIACFKKALDLDPKNARAHNNLGAALKAQGDLKGAIACYKQALALDPKLAPAHSNLGVALQAQGDVQGAIACYRKALDFDPKLVQAHGGLGQALLAQGRFAEGRASAQRALDLIPPKHPLRPWVARQIAQANIWLKLEERLPAILRGDEQPKDAAEQLALADLCQRYQKRYAAAARFYQGAFAAGAARTTTRAYNAARAAILAATGQGEDASNLDGKAKTRLRQQALGWLRDNLKGYIKQVETADVNTHQAIRGLLTQLLEPWQKTPDLESVRGQEALAKLPEAERAAWQQLWADVEALLKKTQEGTK
jgi:tetratricopeptide (TPR) repeat protein